MAPEHRIDFIREMRRKLLDEEPFVCISTSLIEAGVDISFQSVIRSYAGLESIAQAAGRCNRNAEAEDGAGVVYVIRCTEESLGQLEEIETGGNTVSYTHLGTMRCVRYWNGRIRTLACA